MSNVEAFGIDSLLNLITFVFTTEVADRAAEFMMFTQWKC